MDKHELWDQGYIYEGGFYIHLHQKHIGAMSTHKPATIDSLVRTFNGQKEKARQAVQNQYKELFTYNITQKEVDSLNELFKDNGNIEKIDQTLKQFFEESLNSEKATQIIDKQRQISWGNTDLKKKLDSTSEVWKGFDSLLGNLAASVKILNQQDGAAIAGIIRHARTKKTIGEVGESLLKALKAVNIENTTIQGKNLQKAVDALKDISRRLATGDKSGSVKNKRSKDDPITIEYLKGSIDRNFFSTILGESAAMDIDTLANSTTAIAIQDVANSVRSTGKDTTIRIRSNEKGSYAGDIKIGEKRQGKADVKFENVVANLDEILDTNGKYGKITLSIGLSNKAYKILNLGDNNSITNKSLVTGGSIPINKVLDMLTNSERIKYLSYNVLAWSSASAPKKYKKDAENIQPALLSLQDALFTRSTLYLFGARGKADFANFMFVNGKLISMLDILNKVVNQNEIATTSTMANSNQGVIFSMPGRASWWDKLPKNAIRDHSRRVQALNKAINDSTIEGHINPFSFN